MKLNPLFKFPYTNTRLDKNAGKGGGIITQFFGENQRLYKEILGIQGHNGIDYYCLDGTEIIAPIDMFITWTGIDSKGGLCIYGEVIESETQRYELVFVHLQEFKCKTGDKVKMGDVIGLSDNTGWSSGSHLHFGVRPLILDVNHNVWFRELANNGYNGYINPLPFFFNEPKQNMTVDFALLSKIYTAIFHRNIDEAAKSYAGKDIDFVLDNLISSDEWKKYDPIMKNVKVVENWGRGI